MYERTYGYLYDPDRPVKDDAANIRRHIRTMTKAGILPADWKYSVRMRRFAGGSSIDVQATSPRPIYAAKPDTYDHPHAFNVETGEWVIAHADRYTTEAKAVLDTLADLHGGHNHDGSDSMTDYFDVKFYGRATITTEPGTDRVMPEVEAAQS